MNPLSRLGPAHRVLLACMVCQMGLGCSYVFAAMLKHVVAEFAWSRTVFAAGASAPLLFAMALGNPLAGALTERIGPRRLLVGATFVLGTALVLIGRMSELWHFYALTALLGLSLAGLGDVPVGAVAARWFERGRGLALGVVYIGSNLGGALVPVLAAGIVARGGSWRDAFAVIGIGAVVLIAPIAWGFVRFPESEERPGGAPGADGERGGGDPRDLDLGQALRTRSFWLLFGALLGFYFTYLGIHQHLVAFLSDRGLSDAEAAQRFAGAVFLGVFAKLGVGVLASRVAPRRALQLDLGLFGLGALALLAVETPGLLPFFLAAYGLSTAAENVLMPLLVADCFGATHLARIYGMLMIALFPGGVLGPVFAGAVFDRTGDYAGAFVVFAVMSALAWLLLAWVRDERDLAAGPQDAPDAGLPGSGAAG